MRGASREAAAAGREALTSALAVADAASLADELFAVASAVDANPTLRRGLADPSRDAAAKQGIVDRFLAELEAGRIRPESATAGSEAAASSAGSTRVEA